MTATAPDLLQRQHRRHVVVTPLDKLDSQRPPARVVVPGPVDEAERSHLGSRLGVVGESLPVDNDARLVTDDPRVVPGGMIAKSPSPYSSSSPLSMTTFIRPEMK